MDSLNVLIRGQIITNNEKDISIQDLLSDLDENIDPNAVFPWFHRNLSKNEAVDLLVRAGNTYSELRFSFTFQLFRPKLFRYPISDST